MRVVEVNLAQKEAAELRIKVRGMLGEPIDDWTRQIAAARPRPEVVDPELEASDETVLYLV